MHFCAYMYCYVNPFPILQYFLCGEFSLLAYLTTHYKIFCRDLLCTLLIEVYVLSSCFYLQRDDGTGILRLLLTSIHILICFLNDLFLSLASWRLLV